MQSKKWLNSKESKKITGIICITCIVLIVQITASLYFNKKIYDMSLQHTIQQVEELSTYVKKNFQLELEHNIHILRNMELQLETQTNAVSEQSLNLLQVMQEHSHFKMVGISDLDGHGVNAEGNAYNITYDHIKEYIENDRVYISNVLKNGNEVLIFIAVPLKVQNNIVGILWGKLPLSEIVQNIELNDNSYKYFHIIDDKGNYVLASKSKFALNQDRTRPHTTIWEDLDYFNYIDKERPKKVQESIKRGESGNFYFERNGQGRYASYSPLKINNWYLFSIQVQDEMHDYVAYIRNLAIYFFTLLTIGLLLIFGTIYRLIYTMYKNIAKQHQDIQSINTMFQAILQKTNNTPFIVDQKRKQVAVYNYPTRDTIKYFSFSEITPDILLQQGSLSKESMEAYTMMYQKVVLRGQICDPIIICSRRGDSQKKEWIRVSIISNAQIESGQMIGVLEGYSEQKEKDMQIEMHLDDIKKIEKKSQTDFLTKLYNRETFIEKVHLALQINKQEKQTCAFLILDLDHFKEINDCMGHKMGDIVLQEISDALRKFFRKEDIVGRLGGDEFIVFAQNIRDVKAFELRIKRLNKLLCKTYAKGIHRISVSASIGIALTGAKEETFTSLYEKADKALYAVKENGRNGYQIYNKI